MMPPGEERGWWSWEGHAHTAAVPTSPGFLHFKVTCCPPVDDTSFLWAQHGLWVSSTRSTGWCLTTVVCYDLHGLLFPTNSSMLPTERSSPHTACLLGSYEHMDLPHHRAPPSGLRLPPLSVQGGACPLLTTPVGPCIQK